MILCCCPGVQNKADLEFEGQPLTKSDGVCGTKGPTGIEGDRKGVHCSKLLIERDPFRSKEAKMNGLSETSETKFDSKRLRRDLIG